MVFFWNQNNYIDLYQYLDDFIALYLTEGSNHTVGDDIRHWPDSHAYSECDRGDMVFIHPEYVNWGPKHQDQVYYKGFSVPTFNENILSHDYHLHWHGERTDELYCLERGSEPESPPPPESCKRERSPTCDNDNLSNLFGSD
jgi:hypothetical protein